MSEEKAPRLVPEVTPEIIEKHQENQNEWRAKCQIPVYLKSAESSWRYHRSQYQKHILERRDHIAEKLTETGLDVEEENKMLALLRKLDREIATFK